MECIHNVTVNVTPEEMGKAMANCSPEEFSEFFSEWASKTNAKSMNEIAKTMVRFDWNTLKDLQSFLTMIQYHQSMKDKS